MHFSQSRSTSVTTEVEKVWKVAACSVIALPNASDVTEDRSIGLWLDVFVDVGKPCYDSLLT